jgi:hypothetical protein
VKFQMIFTLRDDLRRFSRGRTQSNAVSVILDQKDSVGEEGKFSGVVAMTVLGSTSIVYVA